MNGMEPAGHCCADMRLALAHQCDHHPHLWDCPEYLVHHNDELPLYGLVIHDGGQSCMEIRYCPWCGADLDPDVTDRL